MENSFSLPVANGFLMVDGVWQFQGYDQNGLLRSLNRRLIGAHMCNAALQKKSVQRKTGFLLRT